MGELTAEQSETATPTKQKKTPDELALMIHHDLSQIEGCPQRGVKVTVYGLNPWNAMLTFGVESGPVPNKADRRGDTGTENVSAGSDPPQVRG